MIVELRRYTLHPGKVAQLLDLHEKEGLPIQGPVLGNLIGYFSSDIGVLNEVVHLWGYTSLEDRALRRRQLSAHPDWPAYLDKVLPLIQRQESTLLTPAPFSPIR